MSDILKVTGAAVVGELMQGEELRDLLGISQHLFERWRCQGRLPAPLLLTKRTLRWRRSEIAAWIEAGAPPRTEWERIKQESKGPGQAG